MTTGAPAPGATPPVASSAAGDPRPRGLSALAGLWWRLQLRRRARLGRDVEVRGRIWIHGEGTVRIGDRVRLDAATAPVELHTLRGGEILIGDGVVIRGGTSIEAERSVSIGEGCVVGAFAKIIDTHFHPLTGDRSVRPPPSPVVIEAGAALGPRVIVLPGARVRAGQRVSAGAVVRGLPPAAARRPTPPSPPREP